MVVRIGRVDRPAVNRLIVVSIEKVDRPTTSTRAVDFMVTGTRTPAMRPYFAPAPPAASRTTAA